MRPLENGSGANGEIDLADEAAVIAFRLTGLDTVNFAAVRTDRSAVPAASLDMEPGGPFVRKLLEEFVGADGDFFHSSLASMVLYEGRVLPYQQGVKYIIP